MSICFFLPLLSINYSNFLPRCKSQSTGNILIQTDPLIAGLLHQSTVQGLWQPYNKPATKSLLFFHRVAKAHDDFLPKFTLF